MDTPDPRTTEIAARDAALGGVVQSALDQLASTITQRDDVAQATLKRVQDQLRAAVRTADKQRQQQLEAVADNIMAAIETRQQISESMLSPIVQQLADTGVQVPTAGTGGFIGPPTIFTHVTPVPPPPAPGCGSPGVHFTYCPSAIDYTDLAIYTCGPPPQFGFISSADLTGQAALIAAGWKMPPPGAFGTAGIDVTKWLAGGYATALGCETGGGGTGGGGCGGPGQAPCLAYHWWVVCSAGGDARVTHSPTQPANVVSGPWPSANDANTWILDHPEACGKGPPPPPPPPCPPPSAACPLPDPSLPPSCTLPPCPDFGAAFDCAVGTMPRMGSEGWCDSLDVIIGSLQRAMGAIFQSLGTAVRTGLCDTWLLPNQIECLIDRIPDTFSLTVPFNAAGAAAGAATVGVIGAIAGGASGNTAATSISLRPVKDLMRFLIKGPSSVVKGMVKLLAEYWGASVCIMRSVSCDVPEATVSLVALRGVVKVFQRLRIGADIPVWGTVDITISWTQVEACLDYLIAYTCPYVIPGVGEADECRRKHLISDQQYRCWLMMNGVAPEVHEPVYRAGFTRPGPGERKTWVYRLRPGVVQPQQAYTDVDYALDLQRDGTDPAYTRYLQDTLYRVFQLRELRQLLDANVASKDDILSALLSEGFSPEQAPILRDMEWVLTERKREAEIQGYTPSRIAHLYSRGEMNDTEALDRMQSIGYTREQTVRLLEASRRELAADQHRKYAVQAENDIVNQTKRGYLMGTVHPQTVADNLSQLGILPPTMQATLKAWDLQHQLDQQQESIRGVKSRFETGEINNLQATEMLDVIGMSPVYALQTVGVWAAGITQSDKIRRGEAVLSMLSRSAVSPDIAMVMLSNLGWETDVAEAQIASAVQRLQQTLVRAEQGREQGAKRAALAAEKLALEGNDATLLARSVLKQITPLSSVKKWFEESLVSEEWARTRMAALGIPPDVIDLEIRDSQIKMEKKPPSLKRVQPVKPPPAPKGLTLAALKAWLKDGQISVAAFTTQLLADGYDPGIIDLYITEVCDGKTAACVAESGPQDSDLPTGGGVPPNGG